jgi:predicted nucleic acid-binding protein
LPLEILVAMRTSAAGRLDVVESERPQSSFAAPAADSRWLRAAREAIAALGVAVHQPGESIGVEAARLRCRHPISFPDPSCLATATKHAGASVASFDRKVIRAAEAERIAHTASKT